MKYMSWDEVRDISRTLPSWLSPRSLAKRERLELWAEALDREGERRLRTLFQIESAPPAARAAMRADDSPLSVAYQDPRLRAEGLAGDTVSDATTFFSIGERELHNILCYCHFGETMLASVAAGRVRAVAACVRKNEA